MKPTIKSSIPLTFFRFSVAIVLFLIANVIYFQTLYRGASRYSFQKALISSDGQVTYLAWLKEAGGMSDDWEFDETLRARQRAKGESLMWMFNGSTASVVRDKAKDIERNSHSVILLQNHVPYYAGPILWWNGPAGQVDWYDHASRMRVASLGPVGPAVKAPDRPEERFDVLNLNFAQRGYILTPQGIYKLSEGRNERTLALTDIRAKLVYRGSYEAFELQDKSERSAVERLLIVHGNTLFVLDATGSLLRDIKLPEIAVTLFKLPFGITFFDNGRVAIDGSRKRVDEKTILLLAEDGSLVRRVDYDIREVTKAMNGGVEPARLIPFPTLMPPIPGPGLMEKSALIQSIALSLVLAAIVLWRQTRLGRRGAWRVMWVVFTFVFGLLGFVTYLAAYWDRRSEPCPDCRRPRLVAEEICPHCGNAWPAPKTLGIEIVEPA
jgi:hypothetical protein